MAIFAYDVLARRASEAGALDEFEELRLVKACRRDSERQQAIGLLTGAHLPMIMAYARNYARQLPLPPEFIKDLIQEGVAGLVKAIDNFDESQGARLRTIAYYYIKANMSEFVVQNLGAVGRDKSRKQRAALFHVRKLQSPGVRLGDHHMTHEETVRIAEKLGMPYSAVTAVAVRLASVDVSIDGEIPLPDGGSAPLADVIPDDGPLPDDELIDKDERARSASQIQKSLALMDDRERRIIEARRMREPPVPLEQLATEFGVSKGRISQIEKSALEKLRGLLELRDGKASTARGEENASSKENPSSRSDLRRRVDRSLQPSFLTDIDGYIVHYNEASVAFVGRRPIEGDRWSIVRRHFLHDGTEIPVDASPLALAIRDRRRLQATTITERRDGARIQLKISSNPVLDHEGRYMGAYTILTPGIRLRPR